jgi:hypothetical protein
MYVNLSDSRVKSFAVLEKKFGGKSNEKKNVSMI